MWAIVAGYFAVKKHSGKPDLVHANILYEGGRQALLLKFLFGIPFVCSEHWTGYHPQDGSYKGFFRKMISKMVARNARFILPVTQNLADAMQSHKLNGKYRIVPNTVDTKIFNTGRREVRHQFAHISSLDERQKNFSGIIIRPQAENTLAAALLLMLEKKNTFAPGQLAEKIKQQYSYEAVNARLDEVYKSALSN